MHVARTLEKGGAVDWTEKERSVRCSESVLLRINMVPRRGPSSDKHAALIIGQVHYYDMIRMSACP
jgi:hypothetical protein